MTPAETLSALELESPGTKDALRRLRAGQSTQSDIDGLTLLVLNEFAARKLLQQQARSLLKQVPRYGQEPYWALGPGATVQVRTLCQIAGVSYDSAALDITDV